MRAIKAPCRACRRSYALTKSGTVRDHYKKGRRRCPGAGMKPSGAAW